MKNVTNHEAITKVSLPEQVLPVLVPVNKAQMAYRRRVGVIEVEDGYFFRDVAEPVSVRLVSEDLKSLTVPENQIAFEAKYGLAIYESALRNAFFCLMLAEALAGTDPKRDVGEALRYYRGVPPSELYGEGSPVSRAIQQEPLRTTLEMLSDGLEKARPVVWWSTVKKRASLGLLCPDARSALFALALRGMGLPGGLGACQRCATPFLRSRRTQRYCSHHCQLAASMRRYRQRHAGAKKHNKRTKPRARRDFRRKTR